MRLLLLLLFLGSNAFGQILTTAPTGNFPALRMQAIVGTHQRLSEKTSYQKTMLINPKLILEGASRLTPIPAAEATMLIITMDTRAKYTLHKDVYKVCSAETLPIPAANGEHRDFNFAESTLTFDAWRDATNVGGDTYKYFVCGIRDPATKAIVAFQTNDMMLETFCKTHPEKRGEILKLAKGAAFPSEFK